MSSSGDNLIVTLCLGTLALLIAQPEKIAKLIGVEGFGNFKGHGNAGETVPLNNGRINFGSREADFEVYRDAVNASLPNKAQLERISGLPVGNGKMQGFSPFGHTDFSDFKTFTAGGSQDEPISPCAATAPSWNSASLLPKSTGNSVKSFQFSPEQEDLLANQAWLTAPERIGINTTEGSLRNASQDLRGDPFIIGMKDVSPWNMSTFYPDLTRRPLEGTMVLDPSYKQAFNKDLGMFV